MGNEMGNNHTSAIKEEDTTSEVEQKSHLEDTSEVANEISQEDSGKEENQNIPTSTSKSNDVIEKASNDIRLENVKGKTQLEAKHEYSEERDTTTTTTEIGKVAVQEDGDDCDVKEKMQNVPTAEAKDSTSPLDADVHEDDVNVDHQNHEMDESKDDQIEEKLDFNDKARGIEVEQDGDVVIPIANGTDVQGKTTTSLNFSNDFEGAVDEITQVTQLEKSPNVESVENSESLSSSSLEGTEEYEKQGESCIGKLQSVTHNHHLYQEPSIKQDEEKTTVLALNATNTSDDSYLLESSCGHSNHDEEVKFLSEQSQSLLEENLEDVDSHFQQIKEDVQEKEMEFHEKLLCTDMSECEDENELESSSTDTSGITADSPSIGNDNSPTKVNYTSEDSLNSLVVSYVVDNPLKLDQEENCKEIYEERRLHINGSTTETSRDYKPDQDSPEKYKSGVMYTCDAAKGSINGERSVVLDSSVSGIFNANSSQVTENGLQYDAYINKASNESNAAVEKIYSDVVTTNHEESFPLQNSSSLLHIYDYNEDSVKQTNETKSFDIGNLDSLTVDLVDEEAFEKGEDCSQQIDIEAASSANIGIEPGSNSSIFANGSYETRDSVTRLSTESNSDIPNTSCQIQKSPSFNLNLRTEARHEESDQTPLLCQDKSENKSLENHTSINLINSMPHAEYEEKMVTMEKSYSKKSKAPFIGLLKEEEEAHPLVMPETQENHEGSRKIVNQVSSTSSKGKEKRKARSHFFSSFMCCTTVEN